MKPSSGRVSDYETWPTAAKRDSAQSSVDDCRRVLLGSRNGVTPHANDVFAFLFANLGEALLKLSLRFTRATAAFDDSAARRAIPLRGRNAA